MEYHARDAANPGLQQVIEAVVNATWKAPPATGLEATTQGIAEIGVSEHLLALAASNDASSEARAIARAEVVALRAWISGATATTSEETALRAATLARIDLFLKDPEKFTPASPPPIPPGQPIGDDE